MDKTRLSYLLLSVSAVRTRLAKSQECRNRKFWNCFVQSQNEADSVRSANMDNTVVLSVQHCELDIKIYQKSGSWWTYIMWKRYITISITRSWLVQCASRDVQK